MEIIKNEGRLVDKDIARKDINESFAMFEKARAITNGNRFNIIQVRDSCRNRDPVRNGDAKATVWESDWIGQKTIAASLARRLLVR